MLKTQLYNWTILHRKQPQQSSSAILFLLIGLQLEFYYPQKVNFLFLMLDQSYCLLYLRINSATQQGPAHTTAIKRTVSSVDVTTPIRSFRLQEMLSLFVATDLVLKKGRDSLYKRDYFLHGTLIGFRGVSLGTQWWKFSLISLESSIFLTSLLFLVPAKTVICLLEQLYVFIFLESVESMGSHWVHGLKVVVIVQCKLDVKNAALNKQEIFILKVRNAFILNNGVYPIANLLLLLFI